jgi:hypothetical protein
MSRTALRTLLVLLAGLTASLWPLAPAQAETENCTAIAALPFTITAPGIYCLKGNLETSATSGDVISIGASNVVLDFNGFYMSNLSARSTTAARAVVFTGRKNVTIRNGSIIRFYAGIVFSGDVQGLLIEQMRLAENRNSGISGFALPGGASGVIRDCQVNKTGGGVVSPFGIGLVGGQMEVANNFVKQVTPNGGTGFGILLNSSTNHVAVNNRISTAGVGIRMDASQGKRRDNITTNVATPYQGGIDLGNNN